METTVVLSNVYRNGPEVSGRLLRRLRRKELALELTVPLSHVVIFSDRLAKPALPAVPELLAMQCLNNTFQTFFTICDRLQSIARVFSARTCVRAALTELLKCSLDSIAHRFSLLCLTRDALRSTCSLKD